MPLTRSTLCNAAGAVGGGRYTLGGEKVLPVRTTLPKETGSLCPECLRTISAELFEENGRVMMRKSCSVHGMFTDVIFSVV